MKKPSKEEVAAIDLIALHGEYCKAGRSAEYLNAEPGKEHYKLLAWISMQYNKAALAEVGTLDGCGALALSFNQKNKVSTWDVRFYDDCCSFPNNVYRGLITEDDHWKEVLKAKVIFYDTMHDGTLEREFVAALKKAKWKGMVIFDDIYLNQWMTAFWNELDVRKEDWTDLGHWSGTGVAFFE